MGSILDTSVLIDLVGGGLLKSTLIVGAAWLLTAGVLRASSASVRHWVWAVALAGLLALPILASWLPTWDVPLVRRPLERVWSLTQPERPAASPLQVVTVLGDVGSMEAGASDASRVQPAPEPSETKAAVAPRFVRHAMPAFVFGLWVLGALLLLLRPAVGMMQLQYWTRQALHDAGSDVPRLAHDVVRRAGLHRTVTVRRSRHIEVPLTWGVGRPVILLPDGAVAWPPGRLRAVLLHELAHIRRWDYLVHLLAQTVRAVYWFNPLVWLAVRRMQQEQEQACDDAVLQAGTPSRAYAQYLLEIAQSLKRPSPLTNGWIGMARHSVLKSRVQAILADHADRQPLTWTAGITGVVAMAALALPVASLQGLASPEAQQVQRLLTILQEGDVEARQQAALQLGQLGDHRAIPLLLDALGDRAEPVSVSAALALQRFDDPRVPHALSGVPALFEAGLATPPPVDRRVFVWLEAEQGDLRTPMQEFETAQASGGAFVEVPDGPGNDDGGDGAVLLRFEVPVAGRYAFWGRALGLSNNDNSFFVSVDDGPEVVWDTPERDVSTDRWVWDRVSDRNWASDEASPDPLVLDLDAGRHTLQIRNREDGTRLDRLLITNDLGYEPQGHGSLARPHHPVHIWLEAEDGLLSEPLDVVDDPGAAGGQFIQVEPRHNSREMPPKAGRATYPFTILEGGTYLLWGRTLAPDGSGDSFWVRIDGDRWVPWNGITQADAWTWVPVYHQEEVQQAMHFNLSAGSHTLEVAYREDDTRLDRLLITNDVSFTPSGHGPAAKPVEVIFRSRR